MSVAGPAVLPTSSGAPACDDVDMERWQPLTLHVAVAPLREAVDPDRVRAGVGDAEEVDTPGVGIAVDHIQLDGGRLHVAAQVTSGGIGGTGRAGVDVHVKRMVGRPLQTRRSVAAAPPGVPTTKGVVLARL